MTTNATQANQLIFIVDTREQRGYDFDPGAIHKKLDAGDYSILGFEDRIAIERKSLDDWIGTLLRGKERFCREVMKLKSYFYAAVLIEASEEDILVGAYKSQICPAKLLGLTKQMTYQFAPVDVILAGDRPQAKSLCEKLLREAAGRLECEIVT